ncbi:MAG: tRNA 2-thiouridine(34) synthase MnmA [Candidatus Liptonbacteria bacterium]|nr:tRNA 2-thiouridine(34) synthase MnmA [Candidatus Liptonbacteria bacterium]
MKITRTKQDQRVFVAMSGGVDSSVAALLLKNKGYKVIGVFLRCFTAKEQSYIDGCAEKEAEDARRVAEQLNIPFYVWDFEDEYKKSVVEYMIEGYKKGITPNPDVMCNKEIKFGLFLKKALEMGADYIATGHYVCKREIKNQKSYYAASWEDQDKKIKNINKNSKIIYKLFQAKDKNKDQSYFLWTLTQNQLKYCLFPVGDYLKSEIREIAKKAGLITADKKDSQGICFLGKIRLLDFLKNHIPEVCGPIITLDGEKIGEHKGAWFYTIGQRHLGVMNLQSKDNLCLRRNLKVDKKETLKTSPRYIIEKDINKNVLIMADSKKAELFSRRELKLADVNLINPRYSFKKSFQGLVRLRYRQPLILAKIFILKERPYLKCGSYKIIFSSPQKFITNGQSAVFYSKKGELIGGGVIC